jgi:hypothetical protein
MDGETTIGVELKTMFGKGACDLHNKSNRTEVSQPRRSLELSLLISQMFGDFYHGTPS